ncbi:MAG: aldo/keto reductase, partial [Chthoniobacteraceae bacterium]
PFERTAPLGAATGSLAAIAARLGATPAQAALAWLLHRSPNIVAIPGTTTIAHLEENVAASRITLTPQTLASLNAPS